MLSLSRCDLVDDLKPIADCRNIESVYLRGCTKLTSIAPLVALSKLKILDLVGCHNITDWDALLSFEGLRLMIDSSAPISAQFKKAFGQKNNIFSGLGPMRRLAG
jgi:hypothetical protein